MQSFILVIHILLAVLMIVLILVQHGKGADAGASFGGGGAATVFGASGAGNFLTRLTGILTALFFVTSITLAVYAKKQNSDTFEYQPAVTESVPAENTKTSETSPVAPKTSE